MRLAKTSGHWLVLLPGDLSFHCSPTEGGRWKVKPPPPPFTLFHIVAAREAPQGLKVLGRLAIAEG